MWTEHGGKTCGVGANGHKITCQNYYLKLETISIYVFAINHNNNNNNK